MGSQASRFREDCSMTTDPNAVARRAFFKEKDQDQGIRAAAAAVETAVRASIAAEIERQAAIEMRFATIVPDLTQLRVNGMRHAARIARKAAA